MSEVVNAAFEIMWPCASTSARLFDGELTRNIPVGFLASSKLSVLLLLS